MSFQSLIESGGDCGTANPVVELARQFTQPSSDAAILENPNISAAPGGGIHRNIQNVDHNLQIPRITDFLQQNEPDTSSFNMEALLEQMRKMEQTIEREESNIDSGNLNKPDPLISNSSPSIEKEYWSEITNSVEFGQNSNDSSFPTLTSNNWADEYFREFSGAANRDIEEILNEKQDEQSDHDHSLYRKQIVDGFESFFSIDPSSSFSLAFREYPQGIDATKESPTDTFNLKDLVSDQEERLMNMLLSSNGNIDVEDIPEIAPLQPLRDEEIDKLLNTNVSNTETNQELKVETNPLVTDTTNSATQEKFFYENQFDDMEFWMKLAEDWESSKEPEMVQQSQVKPIQIHEQLDELLKEEHPYHYRFVEENPFLRSDEEKAEEESNIDYIGEGLHRLEIGDIPAAVLYFEAAAKTKPDNVKAWSLLGTAHAKNENDRKAISAMKRCLALEPTNLDALMHLGICFTNESMPNEACYALKEWLRQNGKYSHLITQMEKNKIDNEESYMGPTPMSKRWRATPIIGNVFTNGFFDSVRQCFIEAATISPDEPDADVQCGLGVLFNLSGEYDKAADCFRTAVAVRQSDYTLWNRLGATLANGGNSAEAMAAYREALVRYPGYIRARYNLGISCILLGANREAVDHLLAVLNQQTAGTKSAADSSDSTIQELLSHPNQVTSKNVWHTLRSVLISMGRSDLNEAVNQLDLNRLNDEFGFQSTEPDI